MTKGLSVGRQTQRVADFLAKIRPRGRLIFIIDATASRQRTWDAACQLQSEMFAEAGKLGGLDAQLVFSAVSMNAGRHPGQATQPS